VVARVWDPEILTFSCLSALGDFFRIGIVPSGIRLRLRKKGLYESTVRLRCEKVSNGNMGTTQTFLRVPVAGERRLAHPQPANHQSYKNKWATSLRWTVFEPFLPAALAQRQGRRGMLQVYPLPVPSVSTPTRLPCRHHVPRKGCGKPYKEEQKTGRRALQQPGARLLHAHSES
jgi:hypothetical protein